ncbi:MAG: PAS domain S-box protein, partial [Carboxydocellales bacterium]
MVIVVAAISLITLFRHNAERNEKVEVYLANLKAEVNQLNALEWEAIAKEEVNEDITNELNQLHSNITTNLKGAKSLLPDSKGLEQVENTYNQYSIAIDREFQLVAKQQIDQAYKVGAEQVDPIYHQLNELINQHSFLLAKQANSSVKKAQVGAVITEIFAVLLILFLFAESIKVFELREQKEFSENLIRSSAIPTFVLDSKHNILFWNTACEVLTGTTAKDMIGTNNHWQAFYDHLRPCLADIIIDGNYLELSNLFSIYSKSAILNKGLHGEGWYDNLAGKRKYLVIETAPVFNSRGELIAAIETIQDISPRKLAEEALHKSKEELSESEQTLRAMFRYAAVGIIHADLSGRLLNGNKKFREILGYTREDIRNMKFMDITNPEDMTSGLKQVQSLLVGDITMFSQEQRNLRKDGSIVWVNLTVSLVRDSMNSPKYFVGILEDISERRRVAEILSENNRRISKELKLAHSIQASLFPIN